jgi:uncharacterized protein YkwD
VSPFRLILISVVAVLVAATTPAGATTDGEGSREISSRAALGRGIVGEINALRARKGLPKLVVSGPLASAARKHSLSMARQGFFSHDSQNGTPFSERVKRYYRTAGYRTWRAGENLLWASPDIDARRAIAMWLESPGHRRVLFAPAWREIGISAVHTASAPRAFDGLEVTIVTANFGARVK